MFDSLRFRMVVIIVLLAVIPQLIVAIIVGLRSYNTLEQQSLVMQRRVATHVSSDVASFIQEHENELALLDEVFGLGTLDIEGQQTLLKNLLYSQRVFHELILVDQTGQERIHLSRTDVILASDLISRADQTEFLGPFESGESYFGPVTFDETIREPLMMMAIPILDRRVGDVVAVLIANLRFKPVWDLLAGMELPINGDAYVLNRAGQIVAHRNPDIVLRGHTVNFEVDEGRGLGLSGTDVFFVSQPLSFGDQELFVVAEQSAGSALELAETNNSVYVIVVALSVAAAIGLAFAAAGQIVKPVEELAVAARAIARRDFSIKVKATSRGEIGDLARAFDAMESELQSVISSQEQEIKERREAEAAVRTANEQLQELDQMKSKFIADISHELRTPITNFKLYLDLLTRGKPESHPRYETVLKGESERLDSLLSGILDFASLQESLDEAALALLDFNALVAREIEEFEELARTRDLDLFFTPCEETVQVWGNEEQLEQVVHNLLKNALNYTPAGRINICTDRVIDGNYIRLTVEDTGIGLDEEELAHCFERFYRGKRIGQYNLVPGAGLGLAAVKVIVAFHRGWVEVESEIDQGSTFAVFLPAA